MDRGEKRREEEIGQIMKRLQVYVIMAGLHHYHHHHNHQEKRAAHSRQPKKREESR